MQREGANVLVFEIIQKKRDYTLSVYREAPRVRRNPLNKTLAALAGGRAADRVHLAGSKRTTIQG